MILVCNGTIEDELCLKEIALELAGLGVPFTLNGVWLSVRYTGNEPGTAKRIQELFSELTTHTVYYDDK